jgi:hypothetical protein
LDGPELLPPLQVPEQGSGYSLVDLLDLAMVVVRKDALADSSYSNLNLLGILVKN